jgi:hypothetical protein
MGRFPAETAMADGLKVLRLDYLRFQAPLDPSTAAELSGLLATNPTIEELHVHYCELSLDALELMLGSLAENDTLQSLYISPASMTDRDEDRADVEIFTKMFKTNLHLKHLNLKGCPIRKTGAFALAAMLKTNTTLQVLNLSTTQVDHVGVLSIFRALAKNQTLLELDLCCVNGYGGTLYTYQLADALRSNSTLEILRLDGNFLFDEGACELADALYANCTVKILSLKSCSFREDGAVALGEVIRQNDVLEELYLEDNAVGERGGRKLLGGLQRNWRLKKMTFDCWSDSAREKVDFWNGLTPCGRAILKESVRPSLFPKVLHRMDQDGGVDTLYTVIRERPDLVTPQCRGSDANASSDRHGTVTEWASTNEIHNCTYFTYPYMDNNRTARLSLHIPCELT